MSLPPSEIPSGAMRFNSDSQKLEYWDGSQWVQVHTFSPNLDGGARGVMMGGYGPPPTTYSDKIDYINIASTGDSVSFGDLTISVYESSGCASQTRGLMMGGESPGNNNTINYLTISSTGNAQNFGDTIGAGTAAKFRSSCSSSTRGIVAGGSTGPGDGVTDADYVTIASTGNSVDFGDLTQGRYYTYSCSSPVRGVWAAGTTDSPVAEYNIIDFVTISTLGNAQDFGDTGSTRNRGGALSNSVRGIFAGGYIPTAPTTTNSIEHITFTSKGNSQNFGDLSAARFQCSGMASPTRGVFANGTGASPFPVVNTIDYVTIMTEGNAVDFGDLANNLRNGVAACSNAHGGL